VKTTYEGKEKPACKQEGGLDGGKEERGKKGKIDDPVGRGP